MARRGENIRKRADGRWEARYIQHYDENGKAKYGYLYAKTYQEVKHKKRLALAQYQNPHIKVPATLMNLRECLEAWLQSRVGIVKQSTYYSYESIIRCHLVPALGDCQLYTLSTDKIERYIQQKRKNGRLDGKGGLSQKTVADHVNVLRFALRYAISRQLLRAETLNFSVPKVVRHTPEILNVHDWQYLDKHVRENLDNQTLGILIAMYTGLRIGEICALRFSDIDLDAGILTVRRTMQRITSQDTSSSKKTKIVFDTPKTRNSCRQIPLPSFLIELLQQYQKEAASRESFITTGNNCFIEPRVYYRQYRSVQKKYGIGAYTFHALRHTFATRCIENGCDPKTLSELLGHASVKITLERYVHPSMNSKRLVMERFTAENSWSTNLVRKSGPVKFFL